MVYGDLALFVQDAVYDPVQNFVSQTWFQVLKSSSSIGSSPDVAEPLTACVFMECAVLERLLRSPMRPATIASVIGLLHSSQVSLEPLTKANFVQCTDLERQFLSQAQHAAMDKLKSVVSSPPADNSASDTLGSSLDDSRSDECPENTLGGISSIVAMDSGLSISSHEENNYVMTPPQQAPKHAKKPKSAKKLLKEEEPSYVTPAYRVRF